MREPAPFYTHADHAKACADAAREKRPLKKQVQVNFFGAICCATIKDAIDIDGKEMWKLDVTGLGLQTVPVRLVRHCGDMSDGLCQCVKKK